MVIVGDIHSINDAFRRELQSLCETDPPTPCVVSTAILSETSLKLAVKFTGQGKQFDASQWNRLIQCVDRLITDHGVESDVLEEKNELGADGKPSIERVFHLTA